MGFWDAVASAGPYANNLHLPCSRQITTPTSHQLNSAENYGRRCLTPLSPHHHYIVYHKQTISLYDFFWSVSSTRQIDCQIKVHNCQNLSKRDLNALTVQASTTELGKLFQIFTIFTGRMLFLTPDQQCQSTEGNSIIHIKYSAKLDASNNTTKCYCIEGQ